MEINKTKVPFDIIEMDNQEGLTISKKNEKITIYDSSLIEDVVSSYFNAKYRSLLSIILDINESSDSTDTDAYLVRDKINELRNVLLNSYAKFIKEDSLNKYLKMLFLLEEKIEVKEKVRGGR